MTKIWLAGLGSTYMEVGAHVSIFRSIFCGLMSYSGGADTVRSLPCCMKYLKNMSDQFTFYRRCR
jgi:hypothetical protein